MASSVLGKVVRPASDQFVLEMIRNLVTDQNSTRPLSERKFELQDLLNALSFCPTCLTALSEGRHAVADVIGSWVLRVFCDECPSD